MDVVLRAAALFLIGVKDSFSGLLLFRKFGTAFNKGKAPKKNPENCTSSALLKELVQCFCLNGIAFGFSIYFFNNILLPFVRQLAGFFDGPDIFWKFLCPVMSFTFSALWVLPLLILGKILNYVWFQDIADLTFEMACGPKQVRLNFTYLVADMVCSVILQLLFLMQSNIASLFPIPIISQAIWLFHLCLLYSLYAFEYKWFNMGWPIHKRLAFVDYNWPYFLGFGFPLAMVTDFMMTSYFASVCVFSILFPLYVMSGTVSTPVLGDFKYRPHIFTPVILISNTVIQRLMVTVTNMKFEQ